MDYIEREAAINLTHEINITEIGYRHRCIDPQAIKEIPAADVVPVVRCRECKHMITVGKREFCQKWNSSAMLSANKDFFCAYGERKHFK